MLTRQPLSISSLILSILLSFTPASLVLGQDLVNLQAAKVLEYVSGDTAQTSLLCDDNSYPEFKSSYHSAGSSTGIDLVGTTAYMVSSVSGLEIVDISNSKTPVLLGSYSGSPISSPSSVHVAGSIAYVTAGYQGLHLFDVSNPASPELVGSYDTDEEAGSVIVQNNFAFIANGLGGLLILDVVDPQNPIFAGSYDMPGYTNDVAISNGIAFVSARSSSDHVHFVDISDPSNPFLVSTYDQIGAANRISVIDDVLYIGSYVLEIVDISDLASPYRIAYQSNRFDGSGFLSDFEIVDDIAYVIDRDSGRIITMELSDMDNPRIAAFSGRVSGNLVSMTESGGNIIVASADTGFSLFDAADPAPTSIVNEIDLAEHGRDVEVVDNRMYVLQDRDDLLIYDLSDRSNPVLIGAAPASGNAYGLVVRNGIAYVAARSQGLEIYYVDDPESAQLVANLTGIGAAYDLDISGNFVYIVDFFNGVLHIVDVSVPILPSLAGSLVMPGDSRDIAVYNNFAYTADMASGIGIVDVSDPSNPVLVKSLDPGQVQAVTVNDSKLFVGEGRSLIIYDITNPVDPVLLGESNVNGLVQDIVVSGENAYVTTDLIGMEVFNISNLENPVSIAQQDVIGLPGKAAIDGEYVYVTSGRGDYPDFSGGLHVIYAGDCNNSAPRAHSGGPYTVSAITSPLILDGYLSEDPDGSSGTIADIVFFDWDLDQDGFADLTSANPLAPVDTDNLFALGLSVDEGGDLSITLTVTDADGLTDSDSTTITYQSTPPMAHAGGPYSPIGPGQSITFDTATCSDPDALVPGHQLTLEWDVTPAVDPSDVGDGFLVDTTGNCQLTASYELLASVLGQTSGVVYLNTVDESGNVASSFTTLTLLAPELATEYATTPTAGLTEQLFEVSWTVRNSGTIATDHQWSDEVFISTNSVFGDDDDWSLGSEARPQDLMVGEEYTVTRPFTYPSTPGTYWIFVQSDSSGDGVVFEDDEANNFLLAAGPITVEQLPLPDLIVESITPPSPGVQSGSTTEITYVVKNIGTAPTSPSSWTDLVFIARQDDITWTGLNGNDQIFCNLITPRFSIPNPQSLQPGESYEQTVEFEIPEDEAGLWYFYTLPTKQTGCHPSANVNELDKLNNLGIASFDVTLAPQPDLQITDIVSESILISGEETTIGWTVQNFEEGPTDSGSWRTAVYFSLNNQGQITAGDIYLGVSSERVGLPLQQGQADTGSLTESLERGIGGPDPYFIKVVADYPGNGQVSELGYEHNNVAVSDYTVEIRLTPPPDLLALSVEPREPQEVGLPGQLFGVMWSAENDGAPPQRADVWKDGVYLSLDDQLDPELDRLIESVDAFTGTNRDGERVIYPYSRDRSVRLPSDLEADDYFLFVNVNDDGGLFELDRANNYAMYSMPIRVEARYADLQVTAMYSASSGIAGSTHNVDWTVTNHGDAPTPVDSWIDNLYLSVDLSIDESDALLASLVHDGVLQPGESYSDSASFVLPFIAPADLKMLMSTDDGTVVFEGPEDDGNNIAISPFTIEPGASDLVVDSVSAPSGATGGDLVSVTWIARNDGDQVTNESVWVDRVILSSDEILGNSDDVILRSRTNTTALDPGDTVIVETQIALPIDMQGQYFAYVCLDNDRQVFELDDDNNCARAPEAIDVSAKLAANLIPISVSVSSEAATGQPVEVSWAIRNNGEVDTNVSSWIDSVYLSRDQFLDGSDIYLGRQSAQGPVSPGDEYAVQNATFNIPSGLSGLYMVLVHTNSDGAVYEADNTDDNVGYSANLVNIFVPEPADLIVESVETLDSVGVLGNEITIRRTVKNDSDVPISGRWHDSLFLSSDPFFSTDDQRILAVNGGRASTFVSALGTNPLEPGESRSFESQGYVPAVIPGEYYILIKTDVFNEINETDEVNNEGQSFDAVDIEAFNLILGESQQLDLPRFSSAYYAITVEAGETVRFELAHGSSYPSPDLIAAYERIPTRGDFDEISAGYESEFASVTIPTTSKGTYYLQVASNNPADLYQAQLVALSLPFGIESVGPRSIGQGISTVVVTGSRLDELASLSLSSIDSSASQIAQGIEVISSTEARVTFDCSQLPIGEYELHAVSSQGSEIAAAERVLVEPPSETSLSVEFLPGPSGRAGVAISQRILITNNTNVDVATAYLRLIVGLNQDAIFMPSHLDGAFIDFGSSEGVSQYNIAVSSMRPGESALLVFSAVSDGGDISFGSYVQGFSWFEYLNERLVKISEAFRIDTLNRFDEVYPTLTADHRELLLDALSDPEQIYSFIYDDVLLNGPVYQVPNRVGLLRPISEVFSPLRNELGCLIATGYHAPLAFTVTGAIYPVGGSIACQLCALLVDPCNPICSFLIDTYTFTANWNPFSPFIPPWGTMECCLSSIQTTNPNDPCEAVSQCVDALVELAFDYTAPGNTGLPPGASSDRICRIILRALDPNEKNGPVGFGSQGWIRPTDLPYQVHFENISSATAPAAKIEIIDQLDAQLNPGSVRLGDIRFGDTLIVIPENRISYQTRIDLTLQHNVLVDVLAGVNSAANPPEIYWNFQSIDPETGLPPIDGLTGFLPPNNEDHIGEGSVQFTIRPQLTAETGTVIENDAEIFFDVNEPIVTNTVRNTLDATPPVSLLSPTPLVIDNPEIPLYFSGYDPAGAGLAAIRVFVSTDGSSMVPVLTSSNGHEVFAGEPGHTYGFATQAIDNAGNEEQPPTEPSATTTVPDVRLAELSDSGAIGDDLTNDSMPSFIVISVPMTNVPIEIQGPSGSFNGTVAIGPNGRGVFSVDTPLLDGDYTVTTSNAGVMASRTVTIDTVSHMVLAWESLANHAGVGEIGLKIPEVGSFSEPRMTGLSRIEIEFSSDINEGVLIESVEVLGKYSNGDGVDLSGIEIRTELLSASNKLSISFNPALPDLAKYCITLVGLSDAAGNEASITDRQRAVSAMFGDATNDLRVNNTDVGGVASLEGIDPIRSDDDYEVRSDIDLNGRIDSDDRDLVISARGANLRQVVSPCVVLQVQPDIAIGSSVDLPPAGRGGMAQTQSSGIGGDDTSDDGQGADVYGKIGLSEAGYSYSVNGDVVLLPLDSSLLAVADPSGIVNVRQRLVNAGVTDDRVFSTGIDGWWYVLTNSLEIEQTDLLAEQLADIGLFVSPVLADPDGNRMFVTPDLFIEATTCSKHELEASLYEFDPAVIIHLADSLGSSVIYYAFTSWRNGFALLDAVPEIASLWCVDYVDVDFIKASNVDSIPENESLPALTP